MNVLREYIRHCIKTVLVERKTDTDYISLIGTVKEAMRSGTSFVDITNEVKTEMLYKVYELKSQIDILGELYITIINPFKDNEARYLSKKAEINPNNEMILFPSPVEFKKLKRLGAGALSYFVDDPKFEHIIEHELTHQINKLRANDKTYRSSGKQEYANSTEEIQARLIPVIARIRKAIENPAGHSGKILRSALDKNDFKAFQEYVFGLYFKELYLDSASEETKKRYISRLYATFTELESLADTVVKNG